MCRKEAKSKGQIVVVAKTRQRGVVAKTKRVKLVFTFLRPVQQEQKQPVTLFACAAPEIFDLRHGCLLGDLDRENGIYFVESFEIGTETSSSFETTFWKN